MHKNRRKYFDLLNPTLQNDIPKINIQLVRQRPRLLFVVPNFNWVDEDLNALWDLIPWNLCMLTAVVEDFCDVKILDAYKYNLSKEQLSHEIKTYNADVVGITVLMDQYGIAGHKTAEISKSANPNAIVLMGGVYATANSLEVVKDKNIDFVVIGEGEFVLRQLMGYFAGVAELPKKGICYKKDGGIINYGHSDFIKNLDKLPRPAYHMIDYLSYANNVSDRKAVDAPEATPYARIVTSRGCPYKCSFCQVASIQGSFFRARSVEHIIDEIRWLKQKYGIKAIVFDDDNLYTNKKRAKALFRAMINENLSLPWVSIATAVFRLDKEMLDLMKTSGCQFIDIAIESGSERVTREIVLKPIEYNHAIEMTNYAREIGIFVSANFIIGFPTETWDEIRSTIRFAEKINVDYAKIFIAIPLRNTEMYDLAVRTNTLKVDHNAESIWTNGGLIKSKEYSPEDLLVLRAYEWDRINFSTLAKTKKIASRMGISLEELKKIRKRTLTNARNQIAKDETYPAISKKK